jgi:hypothetical protein
MRIGKKGIAIGTIVGLIILILGFAILLFFYMQMSWTGDVNREVCHQSVIYRATLPAFAGAKEYVPLKCKTGKICITSGFIGGDCIEYKNSEGVTKVKARDVEDIEQAIAKEIVSCWETMGEGKVSIFTDWMTQTYGFGTMSSSCVICSRVAFDKESLAKSGIDLKKMNVLNYMMTHKVPEKEISYYVYLTGEGGKMSIEDKRMGNVMIDEAVSGDNSNKNTEVKTNKVRIDFTDAASDDVLGKELSVMFMQVQTPPGHWDVLKNDLYTLIGIGGVGSYMLGPKYVAKELWAAVTSKFALVALIVAGAAQQYSVYENQAVTVGYCGDVSVGEGAKEGCSVVRTVNYDAEDLSQYCSLIESIP